MSCTMLFVHNLPQYLWSETINHATYIHNRSYTKALHEAIPEGKWGNYKPNVSHLQEFGTLVWVINEQINLSKLEPKTSKVLFMGYMDKPKAICYYDERLRMIKVSCNYCFPKGNDIFTPRSELAVMPLAMHEGESGGENTLASGSVPSVKSKGK